MLRLEDTGGKEEKECCRRQKKNPCVSLGLREMKCELREWNERKAQCRMTITGRAQQTVKEKDRGRQDKTKIQYLRLWQRNVHDVRLAPGFAIFKPREDDLVASDLAVLLAL